MTQVKMKTIKFKNGAVMRVTESMALLYIDSGEAHYVPKSTLKRFWKTQDKLERNNTYLENFDFSKEQDQNFLHKEEDGRVFAYLFRKNREKIEEYTPEKKGVKKLKWWQKLGNAIGLSNFEPKEIILQEQGLKITSYPMYQRFFVGVQ